MAFLSHLAVAGRVSASTQNQAKSALLFLYKEVLNCELPWLDRVESARTSKRLPVVLTRSEVNAVLSRLDGSHNLICRLLYGGGLRIMEALRLRVKDVDFQRGEIIVRDGKGAKDRVTMLPSSVTPALIAHRERVKALHLRDLEAGYGEVVPAICFGSQVSRCRPRMELAVRFPCWQAFCGPSFRKGSSPPRARSGRTAGDTPSGARCGNRQACDATHLPSLLRHTPFGIRLRHSHCAGIAWPF